MPRNYPFHPFVGLDYVIIMYAGVVLGGMGSIIGAFWGGMTIGLVQQMSTLVLPTQLQNAAIFVVFLLIIFFRPQGFFGRMVGEDVSDVGAPAPDRRHRAFAVIYARGLADDHEFLLSADLTLVPVWAVIWPLLELCSAVIAG